MARKRALTEDERELFESTLADARPLKKSPRRPKKRTKPALAQTPPVPAKKEKTEKKETELAVPVLRRRTAGIDGNTADRLRRGLIEPQARLDLHGLSERDAHRALITFVRSARSRKLRMVLIVTGKGGSAVSRAEETTFELGLRHIGARRVAGDDAALAQGTRPCRNYCRCAGSAPAPRWIRRALCVSAQTVAGMKQQFETIEIATRGPGLYTFTDRACRFVQSTGIADGLLTCFVRHTSASLLIQENADPDVLADLEDFMRRLVSRNADLYRHTAEGPDDMPSHIRSALTAILCQFRFEPGVSCSAPGRASICSNIATHPIAAKFSCISSGVEDLARRHADRTVKTHAFAVEIAVADHFERQRGILRRVAESRGIRHLRAERLPDLFWHTLQQRRVEESGHDRVAADALLRKIAGDDKCHARRRHAFDAV